MRRATHYAFERKSEGGNRTEVGAHVQSVLMSVLRTARQQGHEALTLISSILRYA
jgi:hypothetical protein